MKWELKFKKRNTPNLDNLHARPLLNFERSGRTVACIILQNITSENIIPTKMISSNLVRINQQISFIDSILYLSIGFLMGLTRLRNRRTARMRKAAIVPPPNFLP